MHIYSNTSVILNILLVVLQARKQHQVERIDQLAAVWSEHHENTLRDKRGGSRAARQSRKRNTEVSPQLRQRLVEYTLSLTNTIKLRPDTITPQTRK